MASQQRFAREDRHPDRPPRGHDLELEHVREAIQGVRHGEVRVVIQDGVIVQIDRTEKRRVR